MTNKSRLSHFFATHEDLEPGIRRIESLREIRYALCNLYSTNDPVLFTSLLHIDDLGISTTGDTARSPAYLVLPASQAIYVETVPQRKGGVRYSLSQLGNPHSLVFRAGGLYGGDCLVAGSTGTVCEDSVAVALYRDFTRELTRGFKKIRMYAVGPQALQMLDQGARLVTMGIRSPPEYDLRR